MKTLWHRLNSPTPAFWRKVRKVGAAATAVGVAMSGAPAGLHPWIALVGGYLTVAGGVTMGLASITCTDSPTDQTPS
jgi:hypothetical protein